LLVEPGGIGEIVVRGPAVTREYYNRPEATQLAKIIDGDTFWHRMGDVGCFDAQGRLWFFGRKAHRVETAKGAMCTVPCEAIFNQHEMVRRSALVGIGRPGRQQPVICIELEPRHGAADRAALTHELLQLASRHAHTQSIATVLYHPQFPVDVRHNAKIFREKLATWAAGKVRR
jgi:acyl-CoA synthetase (AMP-forming)/AMP-acid ligase II